MTPPPATCQCPVIPERPCGAAITQEDLLCDQCREARRPGTAHLSFMLSGPTLRTVSHSTIDFRMPPEGT